MKKYLTLSVVLAVFTSMLFAQTEPASLPYSFGKKGISQSVDVQTMPYTDADKLLREDESNVEKSRPLRTSVGFSVDKTFENSGRKDILEDGSMLWRTEFVSEGAVMTYLVIDKFNIPAEGKFFIYSPDREQVFGPYTNADIQETGRFETDNIIGDELVVEYYEPANAAFKGEINIAAVMHTYRDFLHVSKDESKGPHGEADGTCHIDVVCPEGNDWHYPINSVVCISITANTSEGWAGFLCSGAMINNVRMDKTPYVLTADHCIENDEQTHKFYFNYQTSTCGGNTGIYNRLANGGVIVARSNTSNTMSASDFALLRITGNLGVAYRDSIFFAGWDRTGASSVGAGVHHPGGDWKKISLPLSITAPTSGQLANKFFVVRWRTNPNKGVTEQGSSGSPLFNASSRIIGTLTSGSSYCDYPQGTDNYGRMSYHWTNNNSSNNARKLQPWLDPDNTGTMVLDGMLYGGEVITGINDRQTVSTFEIYPNPTQTGNITIQGEFLPEEAVCNIYNVMGQLVLSQTVTTSATFTMNVNGLDNGVYFIELLGSERNYKSKLVIAR
ncbi:MAG: T9SS type A sorting domain-containing protein [Bacteroidales bacterium]|nr:T9SS type A sorting domain-containing protein [Bacteroidales bacterium]